MSESSTHNPKAVLALLATVVFVAVVNGNMVNVALPHVGRDFGVTEGTYGWIVTGYALAFGIFNAVNGRLADLVGMKRMYLAGIFTLGAGAAAVAIAPTIEVAIGLRFLQGAGAAALPVVGSSIIARLIPARERGAAMGVILSTVGVAASIGPFLGGFLVQFAGWRFCFAFTALVLGAIPVALRLLPAELNETDGARFDVVGAILLSAAVALGIYGFQIVDSNGVGLALALLLGTSVTLAGLFLIWIHRTPDPFTAPELFRNGRFLAAATVAFLSNATRFGTVVLVPIVLTEVHHLAPMWIGVVLAPGAIAIAFISRRSGALADRIGPRGPVTVGTFFILGGNVVAAMYAGLSAVGVSAGMLLYGVGFALIQSPLVASVSQLVPRRMVGSAMGLFMMIFFIGGAFGTALSVTTVELQAVDAAAWLGRDLGLGGRYSNGVLALNGLAVLATLLVRFLPTGPLAEPAIEVNPHHHHV